MKSFFKKILLISAIAIVITSCIVFPKLQSNSIENKLQEYIANAVTIMRTKDINKLKIENKKLKELYQTLSDNKLKGQLFETISIIEMTIHALEGDVEKVYKTLENRIKANKGKKINFAYFENGWPFAKFQILNVFLKQIDLKSAYFFVNTYPKVTKGKHVAYFDALDDMVNAKIDSAIVKLEKLLKAEPNNKLYHSSIMYIKRNLMEKATHKNE